MSRRRLQAVGTPHDLRAKQRTEITQEMTGTEVRQFSCGSPWPFSPTTSLASAAAREKTQAAMTHQAHWHRYRMNSTQEPQPQALQVMHCGRE